MEEIRTKFKILNTDDDVRNLKDGEYPFALNAINETTEGENQAKAREKGDSLYASLPAGQIPIGTTYTTDNKIVVFSTDGVNHMIGVLHNNSYTNLITAADDCLGFDLSHKVSSVFRRRLGCEDTIYFTDGLNTPKAINITDLDAYKNPDGSFNCELFDLIRGFMFPCAARFRVVNGGGRLDYGSYNIAITYLDEDFNDVGWFWALRPVMVKDRKGGAFNQSTNAAIGKPPANKSLELVFEDLDPQFRYYRVAIIGATSGSGQANEYLVSEPIPITQTVYVYSGNKSGLSSTTLEQIRQGRADIYTAEVVTQLDNQLQLLNTRGRQYPFCEWQKAVSKVCTQYVVKEIPVARYNRDSPDWLPTLMGDEVEEYGVMFVLKGGYLSPVYHVPGRPKDILGCADSGSGGGQGQFKRCVLITGGPAWGPNEPDCPDVYEASFTIEVRRNGQLIDSIDRSIRFTEPTSEEVFCVYDDSVDLFVVDWVDNLPSGKRAKFCGPLDYTITTVDTRQPPVIPPSVAGHDSTVYTTWTEDMAHLIDEDRFEQVLDAYMDEYFGSSPKDRNDAQFAEWLAENNRILPARWQIYNTAMPDAGNKGSMGYYECRTSNYVDPVGSDCVDDYWGVDYAGNPLKGTPIRHHRSPDRTTEPLTTTRDGVTYVRVLGVEFDNLEYPHPDIEGHFFVRVKKDQSNSTVIDKGLVKFLSLTDDDNNNPVHSYDNMFGVGGGPVSLRHHFFISPATQYNRLLPSGDHLKFESIRRAYIETDYPDREFEAARGGLVGTATLDINFSIFEKHYTDEIVPDVINRAIDDQIYVDPVTRLQRPNGFSFDIVSRSLIDYRLCMATQHDVPFIGVPRLYFAALKQNLELGCSLDASAYISMHDCHFTSPEPAPIFGGDCSISTLDVQDLQYNSKPLSIFEFLWWQNVTMNLTGRSLREFYIESRYDNSLRIQTGQPETNFHEPGSDIAKFFFEKVAVQVGNSSDYEIRDSPNLVGWIYNPDYLRVADTLLFFRLPLQYDCCSGCLEKNPTRIYVSQQSFQEERNDMYRVFLPNNYFDIDSSTGEIVDAVVYNQRLLIWTEESMWEIPYGFKERVADDGTITIIGGGLLTQQPPRKLEDSAAGSYGAMFKNSYVKTPYGLVSADPRTGSVILYNGQLEVLSDIKNKNYFKNNLMAGITDLVMAYDDRHNRLLLTKIGNEGDEDTSFTMSFDFKEKGWVGWHSYMPIFYITAKDQVLHFTRGAFWKLNSGPHYCVFAEEKFPHILEAVFTADQNQTKTLEALAWLTVASVYSPDKRQFSVIDEASFDQMVVYTDKQCSGVRDLSFLVDSHDYFKHAIQEITGVSEIVRREKDYYVNEFADQIVDYTVPMFSRAWADIRDHYFIDKVINEDSVSSQKQWFELQQFRDKFFVVRLSINSQHRLKLVTHYIAAELLKS